MPDLRLRRDANALLENSSTTGNVLQNDSSANEVTQIKAGAGIFEPVPVEGATIQGLYGFLTIMPDGSYFYTANLADRLARSSTASDTFTYVAVDDFGATGSTTLKFTVTGINDAPILTSTSGSLATITEDQTTNSGQRVSAFLVSTDADSSASRGIAITGLSSGDGQWQYSIDARATWHDVGIVADGAALLLRSTDYIRFVPNGANGTTADLTYRAWDQTSGLLGTKVDASVTGGQTAFSTATGTASIVVTSVNDAPVGVASSASGIEDGPPITGRVQATDVDSSTLTYALVGNSAIGGAVSIDPVTGDYSFTPATDFSGTASFRFTASDGSATSAPTTVTIAIAGVNDAPVAVADSGRTDEDTPLLLDVLANDIDVDGDLLTISAVGAAANGTVVIENGQVRYSPDAGFIGQDSFIYTIADGAGGTSQATANVSVETPSDLPDAVSITFRQGANGYSGAVDTMLKQNRSGTSFGDAVVFRPALEAGKEVQALLRFDDLFGTGPGQIPVGALITSATLTLEITGASAAAGTLNRMLVNWNGSSTWSSLGSGVQIDGIEATSAGALTVGPVSLGSRDFDVTASLIAWNAAASTSAQQNAANLGWVFKPTGTDVWDFTSSQGAVRPVLKITYTQGGTAPASLPTVSVSVGAPAAESAGKITFNLSLSQAATNDVTVYFSTVDHTAKSGSDYVSAVRSLTFLAGETTKSFDISLLNDAVGERLESFTVQINSATNAMIDEAVAIGRIADDDAIVAPMPAINASVVRVHNLADGSKYQDGGTAGYGIGDPSGLAYVTSLGALFIADSEHDESPYNSSKNLFSVRTDGSFIANHSLTSFTNEPTGLGYNSANGFIYVADDDRQGVYWVSPSNPSLSLGFFDTARLGFVDTEDLKFDPLTGHIHILDGLLKQMVELTDQGVFVDSVPLPSVMTDAEALAYDSEHDLYFVASGVSATIWILDAQGVIQGTIGTLSAYSPRPKIKGLELAPSSNPNDGDTLSLYVVDYGSDQVNDGRMFEINLGPDWFT